MLNTNKNWVEVQETDRPKELKVKLTQPGLG